MNELVKNASNCANVKLATIHEKLKNEQFIENEEYLLRNLKMGNNSWNKWNSSIRIIQITDLKQLIKNEEQLMINWKNEWIIEKWKN